MIELMRQMLSALPLDKIDDKEILILKGVYKLPVGFTEFKQQFKYNKLWQ